MATHDLARLIGRFDEQTVLSLLQTRYDANQIYTNVNQVCCARLLHHTRSHDVCGHQRRITYHPHVCWAPAFCVPQMMLAINPYTELGLYAPAVRRMYGGYGETSDPPPHVFGVAAGAFKGLLAGQSQCILVTGESGAGKTESCRRVLQYLAAAGTAGGGDAADDAPPDVDDADGEFSGRGGAAALHVELQETNCVLEAFGNARTVMNDNSSRFGKFLAVQYGSSAQAGAARPQSSNTRRGHRDRCDRCDRRERCVRGRIVCGASQRRVPTAPRARAEMRGSPRGPRLTGGRTTHLGMAARRRERDDVPTREDAGRRARGR